MKIIHVINSFDIGGNEKLLELLIDKINRDKFKQEVIFLDRRKDKSTYLKDFAERKGLKCYVIAMKGNYDISVLPKLKNIIETSKPDVVHTHLVLSQIYGRIAAKLANAGKIISSEQNRYDFKQRLPYRLLEKTLSGSTTKIVAASNGVKEFLVENIGLAEGKVDVIHNCVKVESFTDSGINTANYRKLLGVESNIVIGALGHLHEQKGHKYLIEAACEVIKYRPDAVFLVGGSGPLKKKLQLRIKNAGLEKKFRLLGFVKNVKSFLHSLDIFVMPSLWEGFGISAAEAMACGKPVIASKIDGLSDIVDDSET